MKDIVIIGTGGFGRGVAWIIEDINKMGKKWNILGFVDDNQEIQGSEVNGYRVLGDINWLKDQRLNVANAIGNPISKKMILKKLKGSGNCYPTLIHPSVNYAKNVDFGEGSIICAGSNFSANIEIGKHVIVNLNCSAGHDVSIGDYSTILPGANISGLVEIEECVSVGTGSSIIQGLNVGKNTIIGAGSTVIKNLPSDCTAVGSPAKPIKFHH